MNEFTRYISSNLSISDSINNGKYNLYDANNIIGKVNSKNISEEFITIIKDGSGVGKVRRLHKNSCFIGTMGGILSKESDIDFIYCCLLNTDFTKEINGATIPHIYYSNYGNNEYYVPKYLEQSKLGELFTNLDNLITLHQRKQNSFNLYKTFIKFNFIIINKNAWEQRKFEYIYNYERPDKYIVNSTEYLEFGPTPVLTANKAFILGYTTENNKYVNSKESIIFDDFTLDTKFVDFPYMVKSSAIKILTLKDEKKDNIRFNFELLSNHRFNMLGHARHYIAVVQPEEVFTTNKQEQDKIGELFTNLDNLITLHHRKYITFFYSWEQRKLGDMCSIITKQTGFDYSATIKPSLVEHKINNSYSFIQNKDFNGLKINLNTDFYIPKNVADQFPKITLDTPSLLISISGKIGNVGFYSLKNKAFIGGAVGICKLKNSEDGVLLTYELESDFGQKYFQSLIKASSHANITVADIRNIELVLPSNRIEQTYISKFLLELDNLITLHQHKELKRRNDKNEHLRW